jgi:antitoxin VapB
MPLSIKNEATERLARQVAGETGESLTEAIHTSLQERWERLKRRRKGHILAGQIEDLLRRVDALPSLDSRPEDEILGYGEDGIPRQVSRDGH